MFPRSSWNNLVCAYSVSHSDAVWRYEGRESLLDARYRLLESRAMLRHRPVARILLAVFLLNMIIWNAGGEAHSHAMDHDRSHLLAPLGDSANGDRDAIIHSSADHALHHLSVLTTSRTPVLSIEPSTLRFEKLQIPDPQFLRDPLFRPPRPSPSA